jgi:hypothetical protein
VISRDEIRAWLGDYRQHLDETQVDRIHAEAEHLEHRWPGPDSAARREVALIAAVQWILGETTTLRAGADLRDAQERASLALAAARQTARMAVLDGMSEAQAAIEAGVELSDLRRDIAG